MFLLFVKKSLQLVLIQFFLFLASKDFKLANPLAHGALVSIARFIIYQMVIKGSDGAIHLIFSVFQTRSLSELKNNIANNAKSILVFTSACGVLCYHGEKVWGPDFVQVALLSLAVAYAYLRYLRFFALVAAVALTSTSVITLRSTSIVKTPSDNHSTFELLILHNNDMHARFEETSQLSGVCTTADRDAGKCYGGFARVAHVVKEARAAAANCEGPPVLYLNAGDTYTGTSWFSIYKWKIAAEFLNALQPDDVCLGNHEFDNGVSGLTPFIENLTSPVLAANIILNEEPALQAQANLMPSVVFDISGIQVGVIGYLTPDTKVLSIGHNIEYIEETIALQEEVNRLKNQNINILIALGHSGFAKDLEIAEKVTGIDLVIGGHTHTFLWNGASPDSEPVEGPYPFKVKQTSGRLVPVVQAYAYSKYLGKIRLVFDSEGEIVSYDGNPIIFDESMPQDLDVLKINIRYRNDLMKIAEVVLGNTSVILDAISCRYKECNLGNMVTDAMVYKYSSEYRGEGWTDAPVAVLQGGGIRASIAPIHLPGNITKGDVINVLPFNETLIKVSINGSDIMKMLEHAVHRYNPNEAPGDFLQMSGLKVTYDFAKRPGMRVTKVTVRCGMCDITEFQTLNPTKQYMILMSSFLAMGGNGYAIFKSLTQTQLDYTNTDVAIEYVSNHSPVLSAVEDRITMLNLDQLTVML